MRASKTSYWVRQAVDELDRELSDPTEVLNHINPERLLSDPLIYVDIGARGGIDPRLNLFRAWLHVVLFEPDPHEFASLKAADTSGHRVTVMPYAIGGSDKSSTLYLTRKRACSSLLEPKGVMSGLLAASVNGAGEEYGSISRFDVEELVEVECRTLATALRDVSPHADILKIDTQGLELDVLRGLGSYRPFLINVECSTAELYKEQGSVFEVGSLLRGLGYFPVRLMGNHLVPGRGSRSRNMLPLHGDCVFVPDGSSQGRELIGRSPEKWLTALSTHGFLDLALWQASEFSIEFEK
jgi:FkbM family methyltransferase